MEIDIDSEFWGGGGELGKKLGTDSDWSRYFYLGSSCFYIATKEITDGRSVTPL